MAVRHCVMHASHVNKGRSVVSQAKVILWSARHGTEAVQCEIFNCSLAALTLSKLSPRHASIGVIILISTSREADIRRSASLAPISSSLSVDILIIHDLLVWQNQKQFLMCASGFTFWCKRVIL